MAYRVGVDVGGTFTDFCAFDENTNELHTLKVLSTPDELGAEGIVIAFINAYRNPANEHAAKAMIGRPAPDLPVFCSSDVWSIIREYERTTTAVIHGYVQPRVAHYLTSLQRAPSPARGSRPSLW